MRFKYMQDTIQSINYTDNEHKDVETQSIDFIFSAP